MPGVDPYLQPTPPRQRGQAWGDIARLYGGADPQLRAIGDPNMLASLAGLYSQRWAQPWLKQLQDFFGSQGGGAPYAPQTGTGNALSQWMTGQGAASEERLGAGSIGAPPAQRAALAGGAQTAAGSAVSQGALSSAVADANRAVLHSQGGQASTAYQNAVARILGSGPGMSLSAFKTLVSLEGRKAGLRLSERQGIARIAAQFYNEEENRDLARAQARQRGFQSGVSNQLSAARLRVSALQGNARIDQGNQRLALEQQRLARAGRAAGGLTASELNTVLNEGQQHAQKIHDGTKDAFGNTSRPAYGEARQRMLAWLSARLPHSTPAIRRSFAEQLLRAAGYKLPSHPRHSGGRSESTFWGLALPTGHHGRHHRKHARGSSTP